LAGRQLDFSFAAGNDYPQGFPARRLARIHGALERAPAPFPLAKMARDEHHVTGAPVNASAPG